VTDEGLAHLVGFSQVRSLDLTATRITDEGIRALSTMRGLKSLNVSDTAVTPSGLLPLKTLGLTSLSFGRRDTWDALAPELPAMAAAFPKVEDTTLPRAGTYTSASLEPLVTAFPKLRFLTMVEAKLGPGALEVIAKFTKLEQLNLRLSTVGDADLVTLEALRGLQHLNLNETAITDTGLESLARFKKLNSLMISEAKTTAAGLEAFKKERPDVKLQGRYYTPPR
jgi:Leucine-rich repeat (LRR) protein